MGGAGRVLVVEDSPGLRALLETLLGAAGYEVATAPHGGAALDLVGPFGPQVILLDWTMPQMGGQEFARRYRLLAPPHAPILLLTGEAEGRTKAEAMGAAGYLCKPFQPQALLRLVETVAAPTPAWPPLPPFSHPPARSPAPPFARPPVRPLA
jgi:two-component system, OmpR family, response regulator MprA